MCVPKCLYHNYILDLLGSFIGFRCSIRQKLFILPPVVRYPKVPELHTQHFFSFLKDPDGRDGVVFYFNFKKADFVNIADGSYIRIHNLTWSVAYDYE